MITVWLASPLAIIGLGSAPFAVGEQIIPENLVGASFLNGSPLTVFAVNGNNIAALYSGANYGPTADSGTAYNLVPSYLSAVLDSMPFSNNETVTFTGLAQATWLNGQSVTIASINGDTFTAPINHADYALTSDTGTVIPGSVTDLPKGRGHYAVNNNRDFAVVDTTLFEIASDGTFERSGRH